MKEDSQIVMRIITRSFDFNEFITKYNTNKGFRLLTVFFLNFTVPVEVNTFAKARFRHYLHFLQFFDFSFLSPNKKKLIG